MAELKLVVFDVDGTLVDSQDAIVSAMAFAFAQVGEALPPRDDILGIVGLSLPEAFEILAPGHTAKHGDAMVEGYKASFMASRERQEKSAASELYPGARDAIERLHAQDHVLLGVATGKSRRGLDRFLDANDLRQFFITTQVSDNHPSKPHPSMLHQCMYDAGVEASQAVMIGDTSYDMDMALNAGMTAIGVNWGYHTREVLQGKAHVVIDDYTALDAALDKIWSDAQ